MSDGHPHVMPKTFNLIFSTVLISTLWLFANCASCSAMPHWQTKHIVKHLQCYDVNVSYPVVLGLPNSAIINSRLRRLAYRQIRQYRKEIHGIAPVTERGFIKGSYEVKMAMPQALSVGFDFETYSPDAAHSLDIVRGFNYSPARKQEIELKDLFLHKIDYCEVLSVLLISDFLAQADQVDLTRLLTERGLTEDDFATFLLDSNGFEFVFNEYQIAPYAAGTIDSEVPYSSVSNLLRTDSPIAAVALKSKQDFDDACVLKREGLERRLAIVAIGAYSRGITKSGSNGEAYYGRGLWYKRLGREVAAQEDFKKAEALGYSCQGSTVQP
jgi:hypothetical protein